MIHHKLMLCNKQLQLSDDKSSKNNFVNNTF